MIIYKATNKINGKIYIGLTKNDLKERIRTHKCAAKFDDTYFHKAILKYGIDGFVWEIIDTAKTLKELSLKEQYYIKQYNTINSNKGYNLTTGGEIGYVFSQESKDKMSKAKKNKPWSDEKRKSYNLNGPYWLNKQHKNESKLKLSKTRKDKIKKGEIIFKTGKNHPMYGRNDTKRSIKIKCLETNEIFNSIYECERKMNLKPYRLKYALKNTNGYFKKLKLTFIKI
jgi:group I intron endonuclease